MVVADQEFFIGRKFRRIVTGDIVKPEQSEKESDHKFLDRVEDWKSKNHKIITWFSNITTPSIHIQFVEFDTAKDVWEFLFVKYKVSGLAQYYQLFTNLNNLKQDSDQSINDF
ncbi:hypothetical protein Sjap_007100 [Stephania japonica]|uniref:Uncharacterized protein n=1 Tax=Stephania japonica TaxID=461633 RepID=A0AAP0JLY5_9MAGN